MADPVIGDGANEEHAVNDFFNAIWTIPKHIAGFVWLFDDNQGAAVCRVFRQCHEFDGVIESIGCSDLDFRAGVHFIKRHHGGESFSDVGCEIGQERGDDRQAPDDGEEGDHPK